MRILVEHMVPQSRGGEDTPENTVQACGPCNSEKNDLTALEWLLVKTGGWRRRATRDPVKVRWRNGQPHFRGTSRIELVPNAFPDDEAPPKPPARAKRARAT